MGRHPRQHTQQDALFGPFAVRQELEIHEGRIEAQIHRLNQLDNVSGASDARIVRSSRKFITTFVS